MEQDDHLLETQALIARDLHLTQPEELVSEEQLLNVLAAEVSYMLEHKIETLMSLLYRLDVKESKVDYAMSPFSPEPANVALAKLILERQKQRVASKIQYRRQAKDSNGAGVEWMDLDDL